MAPTMSSETLVEAADHWALPLTGREVTRCCVDYAVTLAFGETDGSIYVTIEQPLWFKAVTAADEQQFVPVGPPDALGPVLSVLRNPISRAVAYKDGRLEMDFADGSLLRVPVSEAFEAWSLVGPEGLRLVSLPGGELAVWRPQGNASA